MTFLKLVVALTLMISLNVCSVHTYMNDESFLLIFNEARAAANVNGMQKLEPIDPSSWAADKSSVETFLTACPSATLGSTNRLNQHLLGLTYVASGILADEALNTAVRTFIDNQKVNLDAAGACNPSASCPYSKLFFTAALTKAFVYVNTACATKSTITFLVSSALTTSASNLYGSGSCPTGYSDQQFPPGTANTKLCLVTPTTEKPTTSTPTDKATAKQTDGPTVQPTNKTTVPGGGATSLLSNPLLPLTGIWLSAVLLRP